MLTCPQCGCDPTPAERHKRIEQCYEALKVALVEARTQLRLSQENCGEVMTELRQAREELAEMTKRVPGPMRPKKTGPADGG